MGKKNLLVVAHAPSENTLRLFEAVGEGAKSPPQKNVTVNMLSPFDAVPRDVIAADAIILGTTENLGYMSGALKDFFDRCYYPVLEKTRSAVWIVRSCRARRHWHSSCRRTSIAKGLRWKPVQQPIICHGDWDNSFIGQCYDLGAAIAAGLDMGVF